jgi:hypothetical protein
MTGESKLVLSDGELQLMGNTEWILTKRIIIDKVNVLFGAFAGSMQHKLLQQQHLLAATAPKIAKGENYLQLPYVILDYPRQFEKANFLAVRTMFWWGNFFSCTLHMSGEYKKKYQQNLLANIAILQQHDLYICISDDEWQHHFEQDNYLPVRNFSAEEIRSIVSRQHFIKVAAKFSLHQWKEIDVLLEKTFSIMLQLLKL